MSYLFFLTLNFSFRTFRISWLYSLRIFSFNILGRNLLILLNLWWFSFLFYWLWICSFRGRLRLDLALILAIHNSICTFERALSITRDRLGFDDLRDRLLSILNLICRLVYKLRLQSSLYFSRLNFLFIFWFLVILIALIIAVSLICVSILERLLWDII